MLRAVFFACWCVAVLAITVADYRYKTNKISE